MLEVFGQLIRAQLQISATDLSPTATGLIYFNTTTGIKWHNGTAWKIAADLDSSQTLTNKNLGSATNVLTGATAGSFINTGTITLPTVTGTLALVADITTTALTMASKTLVQPLIDNYFDINEEAAPGTPAANTVRIYAKADGKLYKKDDTGVESEVGSGVGSTVKNYLQDWFDGTRAIAVSATTLGATSNRTTDQALWARSTVAGLTIENNAVSPLRPLGDFLINSSSATINSFVESPLWTLDVADLGKPVSIEFDITGIDASTSYDVVVVRYNNTGTYQETISVAGTASTGTPASAQLPTGTVKFRGFYIPSSTSNDQYALRLRKVAAVDDDFQIDSLFVGPQSLAQGAVVTAWQSYTPTFSNLVGGANISFKWRRVGSNVEINGRFQTTTASPSSSTLGIGIPSGLTIDSNSISDFALINQYGTASLYLFSTSLTQTNKFSVALESGTAGTSAFILTQSAGVARVRESDLGQNNYVEVSCTIPISQWSSGTTTLADRAVEEYAWNSNTANSNDLTSFAYGPDGTQFGSYSSATVTKRVRFQTPILSTDSIILEAKDGANAQWVPYHQSRYASLSSTTGMACAVINTTDVDVYFGSSGYAATVYAGASAWSGVAGTNTYKWRLRKVSGGAAVGFPVSARNIVGDTSGSVVPTGMIGEIISSKTSAATATTTGVYFDAATITLAASGTYRLDSSVRYVLNGATITLWQGELFFGTTTGNSSAGFDLNENYWNVPSPANSNADCSINATQVINYNSTTGLVTFSGGATMTLTGGVLRLKSRPGGFTGGPVQYRAFLTATRIA